MAEDNSPNDRSLLAAERAIIWERTSKGLATVGRIFGKALRLSAVRRRSTGRAAVRSRGGTQPLSLLGRAWACKRLLIPGKAFRRIPAGLVSVLLLKPDNDPYQLF